MSTTTKNRKQVLDNQNGDGSISLVASHTDVDGWAAGGRPTVSGTRMTRLWTRSNGMPDRGRRPLPLLRRLPCRVVACVVDRSRSWAFDVPYAMRQFTRRVPRLSMGRGCVEATRRWTLSGDDWECTGTCTETGRNLDDEWKTMGGNQRRFSRGETGFGSVELVQHRLLRQRGLMRWPAGADSATG